MILDKPTSYCVDCGEPIPGGRIGRQKRCKVHQTAWKDRATAAIDRSKLKSVKRKKAEEGMTREY